MLMHPASPLQGELAAMKAKHADEMQKLRQQLETAEHRAASADDAGRKKEAELDLMVRG